MNWQPSKKQLEDAALAAGIAHIDCGDYMRAAHEVESERREGSGMILASNIEITNNDKHAALARAALEVAAQVGAKMREGA